MDSSDQPGRPNHPDRPGRPGQQPAAAEPAATPATPSTSPAAASPPPPIDAAAATRSKGYLAILIMAALLGVPLSAGAWGFLQAVSRIEKAAYTSLPTALGFHAEPTWWPLVPVTVAGLLVAATVRFLPGNAGHQPAEGFKAGGAAPARELPGILIAALASISLGAVIGPEAPLIALGGGLAAWAVRTVKRDPGERVLALAGATGSFAAISALLGSPLLGAFLLMEASGLGGAMLSTVLLPGLLAAGIGALVFVGLNSWTGLPTEALTIPDLPPADQPSFAELGWALVIGVAAAFAGFAIRHAGLYLQTRVIRRPFLLSPLIGLAVAGLAVGYAYWTGKPADDVLFSGEVGLGPLIAHNAQYTVGVLALLFLVKGLAYGLSLSAFRGGPVFPAMFLGAAGGIAMSHLPGLGLVPAIAMGIGAMADSMLTLPLTSVLLATLLLGKDGVTVMPLVIVAVVAAHVASARLAPLAAARAEKP